MVIFPRFRLSPNQQVITVGPILASSYDKVEDNQISRNVYARIWFLRAQPNAFPERNAPATERDFTFPPYSGCGQISTQPETFLEREMTTTHDCPVIFKMPLNSVGRHWLQQAGVLTDPH